MGYIFVAFSDYQNFRKYYQKVSIILDAFTPFLTSEASPEQGSPPYCASGSEQVLVFVFCQSPDSVSVQSWLSSKSDDLLTLYLNILVARPWATNHVYCDSYTLLKGGSKFFSPSNFEIEKLQIKQWAQSNVWKNEIIEKLRFVHRRPK